MLLAALCGATAASTQAQIIYNNLNAAPDGADQPSNFGPLADSFSTGASPVALSEVDVLLATAPGGSGATTISLFSDNATSPGTLLDTLGSIDDSDLTGTPAAYSFPLGTDVDLAAGTRYWIELSAPSTSGSEWSWSPDLSGPGVTGEYLANQGGVFPNVGEPYNMEVTAVPAPEPSTMALGALGVGALSLYRRRNLSR